MPAASNSYSYVPQPYGSIDGLTDRSGFPSVTGARERRVPEYAPERLAGDPSQGALVRTSLDSRSRPRSHPRHRAAGLPSEPGRGFFRISRSSGRWRFSRRNCPGCSRSFVVWPSSRRPSSRSASRPRLRIVWSQNTADSARTLPVREGDKIEFPQNPLTVQPTPPEFHTSRAGAKGGADRSAAAGQRCTLPVFLAVARRRGCGGPAWPFGTSGQETASRKFR